LTAKELILCRNASLALFNYLHAKIFYMNAWLIQLNAQSKYLLSGNIYVRLLRNSALQRKMYEPFFFFFLGACAKHS